MEQVRLSAVEIVSDDSLNPYRLERRTNGLGLPGMQFGWFETAERGRVLAALTGSPLIAVVPTTNGYSIVISIDDPADISTIADFR
jgi:hypothetical protein